jgi:hypothetical protein
VIEVYTDIETVEAQDERVRRYVTDKVPQCDDLDEMLRLEREALDKTAFDSALGEIVCISAAINDGEPKVWLRALGESERDLLLAYRADVVTIQTKARSRVQFVGHNVIDFDRPFIFHRALVHGIEMPETFHSDLKPWEVAIGVADWFDTMKFWCGKRGHISLDKMCLALGLPGKGDVDGSKVGDLMRAGKHETVGLYCADDVRKVRAVRKRLKTFAHPLMTVGGAR